jgi:hypothetical protein
MLGGGGMSCFGRLPFLSGLPGRPGGGGNAIGGGGPIISRGGPFFSGIGHIFISMKVSGLIIVSQTCGRMISPSGPIRSK